MVGNPQKMTNIIVFCYVYANFKKVNHVIEQEFPPV